MALIFQSFISVLFVNFLLFRPIILHHNSCHVNEVNQVTLVKLIAINNNLQASFVAGSNRATRERGQAYVDY